MKGLNKNHTMQSCGSGGFFGIPSFYSYAMADGIFNYLYDNKFGIMYSTKQIQPDNQLHIVWEEN